MHENLIFVYCRFASKVCLFGNYILLCLVIHNGYLESLFGTAIRVGDFLWERVLVYVLMSVHIYALWALHADIVCNVGLPAVMRYLSAPGWLIGYYIYNF